MYNFDSDYLHNFDIDDDTRKQFVHDFVTSDIERFLNNLEGKFETEFITNPASFDIQGCYLNLSKLRAKEMDIVAHIINDVNQIQMEHSNIPLVLQYINDANTNLYYDTHWYNANPEYDDEVLYTELTQHLHLSQAILSNVNRAMLLLELKCDKIIKKIKRTYFNKTNYHSLAYRKLYRLLINDGRLHPDTKVQDFVYYFCGRGDEPSNKLILTGKDKVTFLVLLLDTLTISGQEIEWKVAEKVFDGIKSTSLKSTKSKLIKKDKQKYDALKQNIINTYINNII